MIRKMRNGICRSAKRAGIVLAAIVLIMAAGCSTGNEWSEGPTEANSEVLTLFFDNWLEYASERSASSEVQETVANWRDATVSGEGISYALLTLSETITLDVTASKGTIARIEASAAWAQDDTAWPADEQSMFYLTCESSAYAFVGEKTAAGPDLVIARLFEDLQQDARVSVEGKEPAAQVTFARKIFRLRSADDDTRLVFAATPA